MWGVGVVSDYTNIKTLQSIEIYFFEHQTDSLVLLLGSFVENNDSFYNHESSDLSSIVYIAGAGYKSMSLLLQH